MNPSSYPQILIPAEVIRIKEKNPRTAKEPIKPSYPIKKDPELPDEPSEPMGIGSALVIIVLIIIGGFCVAIVTPFLGIFLIGFAIHLAFFWSRNWTAVHKKYERDFREYLIKKNNIQNVRDNLDRIYANEVKHYHDVLVPLYNKKYQLFLNLSEAFHSESYINKCRVGHLSLYFSKAAKPINGDGGGTKGVTENFFLNYLRSEFAENVFIESNVTNTIAGEIKYFPDFVICVPELNLYIDVEIDEPYIGSDGTPIHFINGSDVARNHFFLRERWLVIRFTELQIVKYPNDCCKLIKETIEWLPKSDLNLSEIKQIVRKSDCWTKDEAHRLAFSRFRNKYLPKSFSEKLDNEYIILEKRFLNIDQNIADEDLPF